MSTVVEPNAARAAATVAGGEFGPNFNLTDNRPRITSRHDGGDVRTEVFYANGIEIGRLSVTGSGDYRIPAHGHFAAYSRERFSREAGIERLLEIFIQLHGGMPRVCVMRGVPLLFHHSAGRVETLLKRAVDFGVLDRIEFHDLLHNLTVICDNARPEAMRYLGELLGVLVSLSAERRDEITEIDLGVLRDAVEGGAR